ncbi:inositol monophosphatase [Candidatus Berkelbacteria bacterium]|nr:inositol monophosphatase [Candidatus Berkelbacteria bacterium]
MQQFMERILRDAGAIALRLYAQTNEGKSKTSRIDMVTAADEEIQRFLVGRVNEAYPEHTVIGEEGLDGELGDKTWVFDPIDGTMNFASHCPLFGIMAAYVEHNDVQSSAIYLPVTDEFFFAERGKGATLNGTPIHCSEWSSMKESQGALSLRIDDEQAWFFERLATTTEIRPVAASQFGSIAVGAAYVASGRRDWLLSFGNSLWDIGPVSLLLTEAGCQLGIGGGGEWTLGAPPPLIAANPTLFPELATLSQKPTRGSNERADHN